MQPCKGGMCMLVLCGVPGSGKSSLCRQLLAHLLSVRPDVNAHLINTDDHMAQAGVGQGLGSSAGFSPENWKEGRQAAFQAAAALLQAGNCAQGPPYLLVVIDDTMHYRSMRHQCYQLACKYRAAYTQLHLRCPLGVAQQRNLQRPPAERIPAAVLSQTAEMFEQPGSSPHAWDRHSTLEVDAQEALDIAALWDRVWTAWGPTPPEQPDAQELALRSEGDRQSTAENLWHQLELACRRHIAGCLCQAAHLPPQQRSELAKQLNACKRELLAAAREGRPPSSISREATLALAAWQSTVEQPNVPDRGNGGRETGPCAADLELALERWMALFRVQCVECNAMVGLQKAAQPS